MSLRLSIHYIKVYHVEVHSDSPEKRETGSKLVHVESSLQS